MSCQVTQALLSFGHKNKLLTNELSVYPGFVVICDTRTNCSLVSCQNTHAVLSYVTEKQTTH